MAVLEVEVVYALAHEQTIVRVVVAPGSTVASAVERSGLLRRLAPEARPRFGIFGHRVAANHRLTDGDRIEIYRPLQADPRASRRARANRVPQTRR
jgi:putative ubiquitin-RnfH superfamily antitoxin RatB of RatAB toxin-antitoxin module